jgi:hypothetical protein
VQVKGKDHQKVQRYVAVDAPHDLMAVKAVQKLGDKFNPRLVKLRVLSQCQRGGVQAVTV